jgi:hypothetical protein
MSFFPEVEKLLTQARKRKTQLEQLDYLFKNAGQNLCIKEAKDLTPEERNNWCVFFGLKVIAVPKLKGEQKRIETLQKEAIRDRKVIAPSNQKRRRHSEAL